MRFPQLLTFRRSDRADRHDGVVAAGEVESGALKAVLTAWRLPAPVLYVVYRPERHRPANAKRLIEYLVEAFRADTGAVPSPRLRGEG